MRPAGSTKRFESPSWCTAFANLHLTGQNLGQTDLGVELQLLSHGRAAEVGVNEDDG